MDAAIRAGIPVSSQIPHPVTAPDYPVEEWKLPTVTIDDVTKASADPGYVIIDVREAFRYLGESEPIDLIAGHIPNAVNVPYTQNLNEEGFLLPHEKLAAMYQSVIENRDRRGKAVNAVRRNRCHTLLALELAGEEPTTSTGEWSRNNCDCNRDMIVVINEELSPLLSPPPSLCHALFIYPLKFHTLRIFGLRVEQVMPVQQFRVARFLTSFPKTHVRAGHLP